MDPKNGSEQQLKLGRPDFPAIFQAVAADATRSSSSAAPTKVAVLVCGPQRMVDDARKLSALHSGGRTGVAFDFHAETFDF